MSALAIEPDSGQVLKALVGLIQLKRNAVTSAKIKKGAVSLGNISSAAQTALKGQKGDPGTNGKDGKNGIDASTTVNIRTATGTGSATAECKPNEHVSGGGAIDNTSGETLNSSYPNTGASGTESNRAWTAIAVAGTDSVTVRIVCASP